MSIFKVIRIFPLQMNYFILLIFTLMTSSIYLSANKVFVSLSLVNTLRFTVTMVPFVITGLIQVLQFFQRWYLKISMLIKVHQNEKLYSLFERAFHS